MKTKGEKLVEIVRKSQQWGSPFLLWFIVELLGGGGCMLLMVPASMVLAIVCWEVGGETAGLAGWVAPMIVGCEIWNGIKGRLKQ